MLINSKLKLGECVMNKLIFVGRVATTPVLKDCKGTKITKFNLIRDEYAGKDEKGEMKLREVSIQFTAFSSLAQRIAEHVMIGDQLIVEAKVYNNNYTDSAGNEHFGFSFEVKEITFGSPGKKKREKLAQKGSVMNKGGFAAHEEGSKSFGHDEKQDIPF